MEKRYQVFISSTFTDLVEERREVIQALLEMDCLPAGMEMFPAANDDQWTLIQKVIDESDYYIVIVGGRYGSTTADGLSYTEREFDYAVNSGKYILGFIHADPNAIIAGKTELLPDARERLDLFREKVKTRMIKTYSSPAELGSVVSRSLIQAIKKSPGEGWVQGRYAMSEETIREIGELREKVANLELENLKASEFLDDDLGNLSQSSEKFEIEYLVSEPWGTSMETGSVEASWDEILKIIGPEMIDEKSESQIRGRLNAELISRIPKKELAKFKSIIGHTSVTVSDTSWDRIKIQLRALGLVAKGSQRRAVSDRNVYWRLTPKGESRLVKMLAVRSD